MKYSIFILALLCGGIGGGLVSAYHSECRELLAIEKARDAQTAAAEQRMKDFFTHTKPMDHPAWDDSGFYKRAK